MTKEERADLRRRITRHDFLRIEDEVSNKDGFAVFDSRDEAGGVWIENKEQLNHLLTKGASWYLESIFNGGKLRP